MPDRPRRLVRLNPGRLPEAAAMLELSNGLGKVRGVIARETMGAVSPRQQVFAVEALLQRHSQAIKAVTQASVERQGRAMSADDAFRFVISEVEYATMASHWLQLVWLDKRLPAKGRPDLSVSKSRNRRHKTIERVFSTLELQMLCVEINATRHARFSASERTPLPRATLEDLLHELDVIRLAPGFAERSAEDQNLLWQTTALLCHELRDEDKERDALKKRHALTVSNPDARAALLIEMIDVAEGDEERFALIRELTVLAETFDPGPPFSRERIGRLSMFRGRLWSAVAAVDPHSPFAVPIIDEALACYRMCAFGQNRLRVALQERFNSEHLLARRDGAFGCARADRERHAVPRRQPGASPPRGDRRKERCEAPGRWSDRAAPHSGDDGR